MVGLVVQSLNQVAYILAKPLDIILVQNVSSVRVIQLHPEVRWQGISVPENVLNNGLVRSSGHGLEVFIIFNLVYVCPCRQVYIGVFCEYVLRSVYDDSQGPFKYDNDQMVFRTSWFRVPYVVSTNDFACEDVIVDISYILHAFLSENYSRTSFSGVFFAHFE